MKILRKADIAIRSVRRIAEQTLATIDAYRAGKSKKLMISQQKREIVIVQRRRLLKTAFQTATGLFVGIQPLTLMAESAKDLVVHNDYNATVYLELIHPDAQDRVFATWTLAPNSTDRLLFNGEPLFLKSDWFVRVRFTNGVMSDFMRLCDVKLGEKLVASHIYELPHKDYPATGLSITRHDGFEIDSQFGPSKTALLTSALAIFYERFLRVHSYGCPELCTKAAFQHDRIDKSHFPGAEDERDFIEIQRWRFMANIVNGIPFPHVELEYANSDENWLARAYVGTVKVLPRVLDEFGQPYPVEGTFKIEINDHYLNNAREGVHYGNAAFWAGVIAHEALHNLGHRHPPLRSDNQYYDHQMIIVEQLVMHGNKVRYGEANPTPVLCQRRP